MDNKKYQNFKVGKEFGRVKLNNSVEIVIKEVFYKEEPRIDIRKFIRTEKYTGWSSQGIAIPRKVFKDVLKILNEVSESGK